MWLHLLVRYAMIGSLLLAAVAWWMKDALPPAAGLSAEMLEEPAQVKFSRKPIDTKIALGLLVLSVLAWIALPVKYND